MCGMVCDSRSRWASEAGLIKRADSETNKSPSSATPCAESDHAAHRYLSPAVFVHRDLLSTALLRAAGPRETNDPKIARALAQAVFFLTLVSNHARPLLPPPPVRGFSAPPSRCLWYILIHVATSVTSRTIARGPPMPSPVDIFSVTSESRAGSYSS